MAGHTGVKSTMRSWLRLGALVLAFYGSGVCFASNAAVEPLDVADQSAPNFQVFTAQDGLSDEIWSTIGFDAQGFVWAGSASSLARFDGYRWAAYAFPDAHSLVRDMLTDSDGILWAIFEGEGLARLDRRGWALTGERYFAQRFSQLDLPDGSQTHWVARDEGIGQLRDGRWQPDPGNAGLPPGIAIKITRTETLYGGPREWFGRSPDQLWFRTLDANDGRGQWQRFASPDLSIPLVTDILRTLDHGNEELWILSYGSGIFRLRADGIRSWHKASGELQSEAIYSAVATYSADGERSLWVASRAGVVRIRGEEADVFDRRHGLPSNAVRGIKVQRTIDGNDVLWLATEGGIARAELTSSPWQTVSLLGASENGIFGLMLEPDGQGSERLWVGSAKDGLALLERGRWRIFDAQHGTLPEPSIRAIWRLTGPDGLPWRLLGSVGGAVWRITDNLNFEAFSVPWPAQANEAATSALSRSSSAGQELWFGTLRAGAFRLVAGRWSQFPIGPVTQPWSVFGLSEQIDAQGRSWVWAAGNLGLARFDGDRFEPLPAALALPGDGYRSVTLINEGGRSVLWASSTRHGVVRLDVTDPLHPVLLAADRVPRAPDPTVYSVHQDAQQRIYVCTNNGVQQLTPLASGGYQQRLFHRRDGLVHDECNSNSQLIDAHDRYWVGTLGGLSVYDPRIETPSSGGLPKPLHFTELRIDGMLRELTVGDTVALAADTRALRIDYVLLAGYQEDESRYRSQLLGYDPKPSEWTAEHSRSFSALPPGSYQLVVEARDHAGVASSPAQLNLLIEPHWWQQPLVQIALAALALIGLAALMYLYNRRLRQRQRALQRTVAERTAELNLANARLTELSYLDPLTGIANRRRLMEAIDLGIARARDRSSPLGLIVFDVDHFKEYNDRHGHLAGDAALRTLAQTLQRAARDLDLIARFGGEEFACLLPDAELDRVAQVAERMRALVEAIPADTLGVVAAGITVSAGIVARVPRADEGAADLLQTADDALYQAKRGGRNRVCGPPPGQ